ncbi:Hypothetical protein D9617_2g055380 [Elsinoe fawcettii]|nr:Hypothetical protein D9617_2g055380 [Elsinoe fawcettii]
MSTTGKDQSSSQNLSSNPSVQSIRLHPTTTHSPIHDLGALSALPTEVIIQILEHFDLLTISNFRRINRFSLSLVDSSPPFSTLLSDHPSILRAIIATRTASCHTIHAIYFSISQSTCSACPSTTTSLPTHDPDPTPNPTIGPDFSPKPATHLYLPLLHPLCVPCLLSHPSYLPIGPITAARNFGLPQRIVDTLPSFHSVPGLYGLGKGQYEAKILRLVDVQSAREAAVQYHGSLARMQRFVNHDRDLRWGFGVGGGSEEGRRWMGVCEIAEPSGREEGGEVG